MHGGGAAALMAAGVEEATEGQGAILPPPPMVPAIRSPTVMPAQCLLRIGRQVSACVAVTPQFSRELELPTGT